MDRKINDRYYQKEKRNLVDYCNICGEIAKLTYDHVPPKCCFNDIYVKPVENLSGRAEKYNPSCSQNGLKYRTICDSCNNGLLAKYDKAIEDVVKQIRSWHSETNQTLTGIINLSIRINAYAKSICGHFLAMKNKYDPNCLIDINLREYVLTPKALPPKNYQLIMRYYPFSTVFALRDAAIPNINKHVSIPDGTFSVLSSFPFAYILNQGNYNCEDVDLFQYCTSNLEEVVEIPLNLQSAFHKNTNVLRNEKWPCNISNDDFGIPALVCSAEAATSTFGNRKTDDIIAKIKNNK